MSHEYSTEYVLPNGDMTFSLSEYVQANVDAERERIIKLLEGQIHGCSGYDCDSCDDSSQIVDLIELIKGETK